MINYRGGAFGFQVLMRMHGSAVFKALVPSLTSTIFFIFFFEYVDLSDGENGTTELFDHPYPMSALIAAFTFLLSFKASFSYNRYWEACTVVHQMHSKWLDVGIEMSAFHLQSNRFKHKPPAFGSFPQITSVIRERERNNQMTQADLQKKLEQQELQDGNGNTSIGNDGANSIPSSNSFQSRVSRIFRKRRNKSNHQHHRPPPNDTANERYINAPLPRKFINAPPTLPPKIKPIKLSKKFNPLYHLNRSTTTTKKTSPADGVDNGVQQQCINTGNTDIKNDRTGLSSAISRMGASQSVITSVPVEIEKQDDPTSSVFLQEAAHYLSLLSAVALSTLRNDLEEAESPLTEYIPNRPWPSVDPDAFHADIEEEMIRESPITRALRYLFGMTRTPKSRTLYNAARPFRVIGGVSDEEIQALQKARGPLAKVALCTMWLQEFISREYLSGSTGNVAPPIISRLYQFTSDGMLGYNQARKIAYIPFPFPHAQITSLFVLTIVVMIPILMLSYVTNLVFGGFLNFCTVLCFTGLHEVSRELENPFRNVPNDIPLNNFQAQFNEALMVMYFGYHPDAWWQVEEKIIDPAPPIQQQLPSQVAVAGRGGGGATTRGDDGDNDCTREISLLTTDPQLLLNGVDVSDDDDEAGLDYDRSATSELSDGNHYSSANYNTVQGINNGVSEEKNEEISSLTSSNGGLPGIAE